MKKALVILIGFCAVAFGVLFVMNQLNLIKPDDTPPHTHTEGTPVIEKEVAATCTTDGSYDSVVYCTECKEEVSRETKTVNKLGHTPKEAVAENKVAATCEADGSYEAVVYCGTCNEEISRVPTVIESEGHDYASVVTAPTCTAKGYTTHTCGTCGDSYTDGETAETGHSHTPVVTAPTCTEAGYTTYTCGACGDSYVADETAATGHNHEAVVTAPTCTEAGYTTYTCSVCGDSYTDGVTDATGHTNGTPVTENNVAATCSAEGSYDTVVYCSTCGDELSRVTETVEMLDHTPDGGDIKNENAATDGVHTTCDMVVSCSVCQTELSTHTLTLHTFDEESGYCTCGVSNVLEYDNYDEANGTCEVTGVQFGATVPTALVIPNSYIDESGKIYRVRGIGESAFHSNSYIKSLEISEGIENIGYQAFMGCNALESVIIKEGVKTIENQAFRVTTNLTKVVLPDSLTTIGSQAFRQAGENAYMEQVGADENIENIKQRLEIYIGKNVNDIGDGAFYGCGIGEGDATQYYVDIYFAQEETFGESTTEKLVGEKMRPFVVYSNESQTIDINNYNENNKWFLNATKYYYTDSDTKPNDGRNYWHYVDGEPTIWE